MQKTWNLSLSNPSLQEKLARELNIPLIMAQLLINRGLSDSEEVSRFLRADICSLGDPRLLPDMDKALARIKRAIAEHETIAIYGDYDVDGLTSSALLREALKKLGARKLVNFLPNRLEEGYGLSVEGLKKLEKEKPSLVISVDCGTNSTKEVEYLKRNRTDIIITDHHEPREGDLPPAAAIINPKLSTSRYPFRELAGVGVVYRLVEALGAAQPDQLELVALGTISDIVPLLGENRVLSKHGLLELIDTRRVGLRALMQVARLAKGKISSKHVGYIIGPRLNAQGRLGSAQEALKLLLTEDHEEALKLAKDLNNQNRQRQKIEQDTLKEAIARLEREINFSRDEVIVLGGDGWHRGVLGIVASRIVDRYFRPTILFSFEGDEGRGSGRSISGFHLFEAVKECSDHLIRFGGHQQACGLSVKKEKFEDFRSRFNQLAGRMIAKKDLIPTINIELELKLADLDERSVEVLEDLEPFGLGNPAPVFCTRDLTARTDPVPIGRNGIKFWVTDGGSTYQVLGFGRGEDVPARLKNKRIDLAYKVNLNDWRGDREIELRLEDIKL